jgi:uncharacterized membrane protein (UPF0127 family)
MKTAERVVMILIVLALLCGAGWMYYTYQKGERELREAVARGEYEIPVSEKKEDVNNWRTYYPEVVPIIIGTTTLYASVADSMPELIKGLSDTPYLPAEIVKLFAFGTDGKHAIWMKNMNYPLDIIWLTEEGKVVHIVEDVSPDTYPESFAPPVPARYVIEANAGLVASTSLAVGDEIVVPKVKQ